MIRTAARYLSILVIFFSLSKHLSGQENSPVNLVRFEPSECLEEYHVYKLNNRIVSIQRSGDTTMVEVSVRANCCISMSPDIKVHDDTIMFIYDLQEIEQYTENGFTYLVVEECECDCCFSFKYYLTGMGEKNYIFRTRDEILEISGHKYTVCQEPQFEVRDQDTINCFDQYGMKQGLHNIYDKENRIIRSLFYYNDLIESGLIRRTYSVNGFIESELYQINDTLFRHVFFNENGIAIRECPSKGILDMDESSCIEY